MKSKKKIVLAYSGGLDTSIILKLESLCARSEDIKVDLSAEVATDNMAKFTQLNKEFSEITPVANLFKSLQDFEHELSGAKELLDSGDHIIASDDLYGGTYRLMEDVRKRTSSLEFSFVDFSKTSNIIDAIKPNTKMLWLETPSNPLLKITDLEAVSSVMEKKNIIKVCDNTFSSPRIQQPLDFGFDIVMHSATKYIGGHSDVVAGLAVTSKERSDLSERLAYLINASGGMTGPFDSFMLLRSLKTLSIRMEKHSENAQLVAEFLESHPLVSKTIYPGLESHPEHNIAKKQMKLYGGMVTFVVSGGLSQAKKVLENKLGKKFKVIGAVTQLGILGCDLNKWNDQIINNNPFFCPDKSMLKLWER